MHTQFIYNAWNGFINALPSEGNTCIMVMLCYMYYVEQATSWDSGIPVSTAGIARSARFSKHVHTSYRMGILSGITI